VQRASSIAVLLLALATAGCSQPTERHAGLTEDEARVAGMRIAVEERGRRDSDLYKVPLGVGTIRQGAFASGSEYWDVTLVDPDGIRRVCVRVRAEGRNVSVRRCDPADAPPPSQPSDEETGTAA
jgi:hypothetical protein